MSLLFRLALTLLHAAFRTKLNLFDESRVLFRVLPHDLDLNLHMNNGRYLTLMDLGRVDLFVRTGIFRLGVARGWQPVVGSEVIRFKRSLKLFQTFELRSRLITWDQKWFLMEQSFWQNDVLCAQAQIQGLLRAKTGNVPPAEVLTAMGHASLAAPADDKASLTHRVWQEIGTLWSR